MISNWNDPAERTPELPDDYVRPDDPCLDDPCPAGTNGDTATFDSAVDNYGAW